jgi:prevent-host-death family protein
MEIAVAASITGEQLQKNPGYLRAEARRNPVVVTYHGRAELVVMSVEDFETLRHGRKLAYRTADMSTADLQRIASNRMDERRNDLNSLLDD